MGLARFLETTPSIFEEGSPFLDPCSGRGHEAGLFDQLGLGDRIVDQGCCPLVVALGREVRAERRCALPGPDLRLVGSLSHVGSIIGVGVFSLPYALSSYGPISLFAMALTILVLPAVSSSLPAPTVGLGTLLTYAA